MGDDLIQGQGSDRNNETKLEKEAERMQLKNDVVVKK